MSFRPLSFYLPSSTEVTVFFSSNLSESLSSDNFSIKTLNNTSPDLTVKSISIIKNYVLIKTSPQNSNTFYKLSFSDTPENKFESIDGNALLNDSVSRSIFFVGFNRKNPIKDRAYNKVPKIYNLENSKVKDILEAQFDEIYEAQRSVGEALSENYIRVKVEDEFRTRTSGSRDILANENAYKITRVSKSLSSQNLTYNKLNYTSSSETPRHNSVGKSLVSIQEVTVTDEEISISSTGNSFDRFILNVRNKNIIKLLSLKIIRESDTADCDGKLGTDYDIEKYKYSILDDSYDLGLAFKYEALKNNQILLSQNSIEELKPGDKVILSYLYKNKGRVLGDLFDAFQVIFETNESIPSNSKSFFLKNNSIVDSSGKDVFQKGVKFYKSENNRDTPSQFKVELSYENKQTPENPGEYVINYETGEVFVFGINGVGTGENSFVCEYYFKRVLKENFDYYLDSNNFGLNQSRIEINSEIFIEFNYDDTFTEDDYINLCHQEVLSERVESNVTGSFSIKTKKGPVTDIFRIYNETTGEVYNAISSFDNEIFFSGNRSPEIKENKNEQCKFSKVFNEELIVFSKFLNKISDQKVVGVSGSNLQIDPGIPAELINLHSDDYFLRKSSLSQDINIKFFSNIDSNNLVKTLNVGNFSNLFNINDIVNFGLLCFSIDLENDQVLSEDFGSIGAITNSSISFSDNSFVSERIFNSKEDVYFDKTDKVNGSLAAFNSSEVISELSRLRRPGEYSVDYTNGIVYLAIQKGQLFDIGFANYYHGFFQTRGANLISVSECNKNETEFSSFKISNDGFNIIDLNSSLDLYDGSLVLNENNIDVEVCKVLNNYTVYVYNYILFVKSISGKENFANKNLDKIEKSLRVEEKTPLQLTTPVSEGGYNLYSSDKVSFSKNVIDFKAKAKLLGILDSGSIKFTIDGDIQKVFSMEESSTGAILFSDDFIYRKDQVFYSRIQTLSSKIRIRVSNFDIFSNIDSQDYIVDSNSNLYQIVTIDPIGGFIDFSKISTEGSTFVSTENLYSGVLAEVTYTSSKAEIKLPQSSGISTNSFYTFRYIDSSVPEIGTELGVSYSSGVPISSYLYVYDNIIVSYEYGRNELDWSISDVLGEGDNYFVSYEYGALRRSLKRNFGDLTQIPYFTKSGLSTDREIYRDAVEGALQSFPQGPTIPSIKNIVSSVSKTEPEIVENFFGDWVLGRDHLATQKPQYDGVLSFSSAKYSDGLDFEEGISVRIPAESNISLDEGSISTWIKTGWSGIENDGILDISVLNFGEYKFEYDESSDFLKQLSIFNFENSAGIVDYNGVLINIYNYNLDGSKELFSLYGVIKKYDLRGAKKYSSGHKFEIDLSRIDNHIEGSKLDSYSKEIDLFYSFSNDGIKGLIGEATLSPISSEIVASAFDYDFIAEFKIEVDCKKETVTANYNNISDIEEKVIKVDLPTPFKIEDLISAYSAKELNLYAYFKTGELFKVLSYLDSNGNLIKDFKSDVYSLAIGYYPENSKGNKFDYEYMSTLSLPSEFYLYSVKYDLVLSDNNSKTFLSAKPILMSNKEDLVLDLDISLNKISVNLEGFSQQYYYSDLYYIANISSALNLSSFDSTELIKTFGIGFFLSSFEEQLGLFTESFFIAVTNRFDEKNIYIGSEAQNPDSYNFKLDKNSEKYNVFGLAPIAKQGLYLGIEEVCEDLVTESDTYWVVRGYLHGSVSVPKDVIEKDLFLYEDFRIDYNLVGSVKTNGEFSLVSESNISEVCLFDQFPIYHLRYCGDGRLEDKGWVSIEDSQSDLINVVISGTQTTPYIWNTSGGLNTSSQGNIYRITDAEESVGSKFLSTLIPDYSRSFEYSVSLKILSLDSDYISTFGLNSGYIKLTGITPISIKNSFLDIKISFGYDEYDSEIIVAYKDGSVVDFVYFDWNNSSFNSYGVVARKELNQIDLYVNGFLYFSFSSAKTYQAVDSKIFFYYLDSEFLKEGFEGYQTETVIDIDHIEYIESKKKNKLSLESNDLLLFDDKEINFNFKVIDGYEAYSDGYIEKDLDEFVFITDKFKYIYDNYNEINSDRISLYKDGKGFLNFEVINNNESYKLSSNIKNLEKGSLHNLSTSWRLNRNFGDELRLFVDGEESANLIKFGSKYNLLIEDRFADVQKERLQHFLVSDIKYFDVTVGSVSASQNILNSSDYTFVASDLGRSVIVTESPNNPDLVGKAFVIIEVTGGSAYLGDIDTLSEFIFQASDSNFKFQFPPRSGMENDIITDFANSKFTIHRKDQGMLEYEMGGLLYSTDLDEVAVVDKDLKSKIEYRANISNRTIEFIKLSSTCSYVSSIERSDMDIYINNYGLTIKNLNTELELPSTTLRSSEYGYFQGKISSIKTSLPDVIRNEDVSLQKIILQKTIPEFVIVSNNISNYSITFEKDVESKLTSQFETDSVKQNSGRYISLYFDSDNVDYCVDGYVDYYSSNDNYVIVYGTTKDGSNQEIFNIDGNGIIKGNKLFLEVTKIEGYLNIVDTDYEPCVISILERDSVFLKNGVGSYARLFDFANGEFIISDATSEIYSPYELTIGFYKVSYPTKLKIGNISLGDDLYIGTDFNKNNSCFSTLDEFKVMSEALEDSRAKSSSLPTRRNIYEEFISPTPACPDINTNALIPFDSPFDVQLKRLKEQVFLDSNTNQKYKLDNSQLSALSPYFNNEAEFISRMMSFGFGEEESLRTYIVTHKAENGPIYNISKYYSKNDYKYPLSASGPNKNFKGAGRFKQGYSLSILDQANIIGDSKGTVEFWVSPELDTLNDKVERYYFSANNVMEEIISVESARKVVLKNKASKVLSIQLLSKSDGDFDTIYDPLEVDPSTGLLDQGTGVQRDFSNNHRLLNDGKTIILEDALPANKLFVKVFYISASDIESFINIYKTEYSTICLELIHGGVVSKIEKSVRWSRDTWHRIMGQYDFESGFFRLFLDGNLASSNSLAKPKFSSTVSKLYVGTNNVYYSKQKVGALSRISNIRVSSKVRPAEFNIAGNLVDKNYSSDTDNVNPVVEDDFTTLLIEFEPTKTTDFTVAQIFNPVTGIFSFDVNISDSFGYISENNLEELIDDLVKRLRPAHTNYVINIVRNRC